MKKAINYPMILIMSISNPCWCIFSIFAKKNNEHFRKGQKRIMGKIRKSVCDMQNRIV